jgi:hypothetical protein
MDVDPAVLQEMTGFIEETDKVLEKHAALEAKIAADAPAVADKLIKAGMLQPNERAIAIQNLQDPTKMLAALDQIATSKIASVSEAKNTQIRKMGSSGSVYETATTKQASEKDGRSQADLDFERRFGL